MMVIAFVVSITALFVFAGPAGTGRETLPARKWDRSGQAPQAKAPPSQPKGRAPAVAAVRTQPYASAGMVVQLDTETGRVGMPTAAFRARIPDPALSRSMEGLNVVTKPDGSKMINLQGRFQEYVVIRLTPDGRKVQACVDGPDVDAALHGRAPGDTPASTER
jgi:hypothetical protein